MSIKTIYDEQGRSWVEVDDEQWAKAQFATYFAGMDVT